MRTEERERFEVLLENIQTSVNVIAEGHVALVERFDRMDIRFDRLEAKVDRLEGFAGDTQRRLKRIEGHLELNGSSSPSARRKVARASPPKRHKKN